jgi:hypothetical protein
LSLPPLTYLPLKETELQKICDTPPREGREKKAGWRVLTSKVKVNESRYYEEEEESSSSSAILHVPPSSSSTTRRSSRLLCSIYTYGKRRYIVQSVVDTWGWRCDGFFAASTETVVDDDSSQPGFGAIDLPHEGPESYENMWMKTRSIWAYIHDHYLEDFDFFYLSGDDTHVIVENLRSYLESLGSRAKEYPLYLGHWIPDLYDHEEEGAYFCGGGPGYILNRKALRILVRDILPHCNLYEQNPAEDRILGGCFRSFGILGNNSVDETGAQRFHGMDPQYVGSFKGDSRFYKIVYEYWGKLFGFRTGLNITSSESISFHLLKYPKWLKRHHAILYKSCPKGTALGDALPPE